MIINQFNRSVEIRGKIATIILMVAILCLSKVKEEIRCKQLLTLSLQGALYGRVKIFSHFSLQALA